MQSDESNPRKKDRGRGIYLLPNFFTTCGLFSGFYGIVAATHGHFTTAAIAIFLAMIFDSLDGRVARMTDTQTAFGAEYDSLADMVSFGMAPALVMHQWALSSLHDYGPTLGKAGWLAAFIFVACAALRLARFNTQVGVADKRYFTGLPSPAAAGILASLVWMCEDLGITGNQIPFIALLIALWAGLLMVSNISYYSFKDFNLRNRVPFIGMVGLILAIVLASIDTPKVLFVSFMVYSLSGPLIWIIRKIRKRRRLPK